jgi:hypothetical protein
MKGNCFLTYLPKYLNTSSTNITHGDKKMVVEIKKEINKDEDEIVFRCPKDKTVLWREYIHNGAEVRGDSCKHFIWEPVGNFCYENPDEYACTGTYEIVRNSVKKIIDGTTIWFLVPVQ